MKLRLDERQIRLRLENADLERLQRAGKHSCRVAVSPGRGFTFVLEGSLDVPVPMASWQGETLLVQWPAEAMQEWLHSHAISLRAEQANGPDSKLVLLVEKDLGCVHPEGDSPADKRQGPLADEGGD
jgi:hypothetical protein